jgi:hypothetical protein
MLTATFTGDGAEDFAVVAVRRAAPERRIVVIFNGRFGRRPVAPAFQRTARF